MKEQLIQILIEHIGLSAESAQTLIQTYGELDVQRHAMYFLYAMNQGRVKIPPAWFTASLKHNWSAPVGMPPGWEPTVLRFRIDENTFAEIQKTIHDNSTSDNPI